MVMTNATSRPTARALRLVGGRLTKADLAFLSKRSRVWSRDFWRRVATSAPHPWHLGGDIDALALLLEKLNPSYALVSIDALQDAVNGELPDFKKMRATLEMAGFDVSELGLSLEYRRGELAALSERLWGSKEFQFMLSVPAALASMPEIILPLGYDAVRMSSSLTNVVAASKDAEGLDPPVEDWERIWEFFQRLGGTELCSVCRRHLAEAGAAGPEYRDLGGSWHPILSILDRLVPDADSGVTRTYSEWVEQTRSQWIKKLLQPQSRETDVGRVELPGLWVPAMRTAENRLPEAVASILGELSIQGFELRSLSGRALEELVAELLRGFGMRVNVTKQTWDGGRDIVAAGELIPGEETILAVECKQVPVVGIDHIRRAMWANRDYPALLFATSGRFSGAVLRERQEKGLGLRLYLKDGLGLRQWIDLYVRTRDKEVG